jgi:hypothetical protein
MQRPFPTCGVSISYNNLFTMSNQVNGNGHVTNKKPEVSGKEKNTIHLP